MANDLAEVSARFGAALRRAGLPVGPGRCERFAAAVAVAKPTTASSLYLCALATLVSGRDEAQILRAVFDRVFGRLGGTGEQAEPMAPSPGPPGQPPRPPEELLADAVAAAKAARPLPASSERSAQADDDARDRSDEAVEHRYLGASVERLASKDFAELSADELASLASLMRQITLAVPNRVSRRQRRRPGGQRTDMRATLRQARRTGGDAFRLIGRTSARRPRRLVVLCDISGSMEPYARAMIQLLYSAVGAADAEVFTFATRLTRLTPALRRSLPGPALRRAGQTAPDWFGGTKIGAALKEFNDSYGRRGMARGAVVLIISDGWETGDPELVRREMARLSLVAFRIVWVNPRTKSEAYQPLAGGMAAAWPHCDAVISAHTVQALSQLTAALADPVRRRALARLTSTAPSRRTTTWGPYCCHRNSMGPTLLSSHTELSGACVVWFTCCSWDMVLPSRSAFQAELIALRVGQHHPRHSWRLRVKHAGTEPGEPGHLGPLIVPVRRDQVQVQPVLDDLRLGNPDEVQSRAACLWWPDGVLLVTRRDVPLVDVPAGDLAPEPGQGARIGTVKGDVQDD